LIVYKKRITTKQSYKKVPAISILIYIKWTKSSYKNLLLLRLVLIIFVAQDSILV
jgi:hypothetical protein